MDVIKVGPEEYRKVRFGKLMVSHGLLIALLSIISALLILFIGIVWNLHKTYETLALLIIITFSIAFLPILFYKVYTQNLDKNIEERYPSFLRDLAEALASGMTLVQALKHVSQVDYGPLSPFIKKLYTWLSWGVDFSKAFEKYNKFFKNNPTIVRVNYIILEAYKEGGNMEKVLETVANDLESIKELDKLKKSYISQQVMVLYVIFFIFVGLIVMLKYVLQPMITQQVMLKGTQGVFGMASQTLDLKSFKIISALAIIIEGVIIAFVIGVVETGKISSGLKHLAITLTSALVIALLFILPEQVSLSLFVYPKQAYLSQEIQVEGMVAVDAVPINNENIHINIIGPASITESIPIKNGKFVYKYTPTARGEYRVQAVYTRNGKRYAKEDRFVVS